MGADLLLAAVVHDANAKLDWAAGRKALRSTPISELRDALSDELVGLSDELVGDYTNAEVRGYANEIITNLKRELRYPNDREAYCWNIRNAVTIHIRGGTSWGDDPSAGYTAFRNAYYLPSGVLAAIGLDVR